MIEFAIDPLHAQIAAAATVFGLLLGALITWAVQRRSRGDLESRVKQQEALELERMAAFEVAGSRISQAFADVAQQSLRANSENFLRMAEQNLGAQHERARREMGERERAVEDLVAPIRQALEKSQQQITELEKSRREAYGGIRSQLEQMQLAQQSLTRETQNLVKALRRPEVRGRWGEITLRRLVELAGMVEHCDFAEQVHRDDGDAALRPDLVVHMPDRRTLVVDVKTPLDAYLEALEATTDQDKQQALTRHARNLREHIRKLAAKSYWQQFADSPEFVILFIPGDQFLSAALNEDPDLIETALAQQIILATPTSFVALLKAVAYGWRQLALADNAEEIRRLAEDLHRRLASFVGHLDRVGRQLAAGVESYNKAVGSLERQVLPGARKFVDLGIRPKKPIDRLEPLEATPRNVVEPRAAGADDAPNDSSEPASNNPDAQPAIGEAR